MLRTPMRPLSSQVRYAISGIFDLAYNAEMKPVQLRVIGERQNIPPRYLEQIFQRLRRAGLVAGKRGPGGGYTLVRGTSEITLRDVVEAVEGPIVGGDREAGACDEPVATPGVAERAADGSSDATPEVVDNSPSFLWDVIAERFAAVLAETTIDDLCQESARRGVHRADSEFLTYQI
ncbi:MAG: Rrf2 family protein [Myxococcota bacterium]|jgi:Rrf2 family protein